MKIFNSIDEISAAAPLVVKGLTIGNFDGVHVGHQSLIQQLKKNAGGGPVVVVTFNPHPIEILSGITVERLFAPHEQMLFLQENQVDYVFSVTFDQDIAKLSAIDFLKKFIFNPFSPQTISIGYDFVFGHQREGNFSVLKEFAQKKYCQVFQVPPFMIGNEIVSSTLIRESLRQGDLNKAKAFLGRNFFTEGQVVRGYQRGRKLGVPTANLGIQNSIILKSGVYATLVELDGQRYPSVTNIGNNPTFSNLQRTIESHILDFDRDIYGHQLKLHFLKRLRDEKKFDSLSDLKAAISLDIQQTKDFFKS